MGNYRLGRTSAARLRGVHPDLQKIVRRAIQITEQDFTVFEGLRDIRTQRKYVQRGVSKTMNSRHLTGHAVDLVPYIKGKLKWDWPGCHKIAKAVKQAAKELRIPIQWGGDWRTFKDGPHFQLPRRQYP